MAAEAGYAFAIIYIIFQVFYNSNALCRAIFNAGLTLGANVPVDLRIIIYVPQRCPKGFYQKRRKFFRYTVYADRFSESMKNILF